MIAGLAFGTNFLPVKRVSTGDGIFFSFCMSLGIMPVGLMASFAVNTVESNAFQTLPQFHAAAMIGGACWMLGNCMCPLIIRWIGLGLGLTVWDLTNMIVGWATGCFGLFGVRKEPIANQAMNYAGVLLAVVSLFVFSFAKDTPQTENVESDPTKDLENGQGQDCATTPISNDADQPSAPHTETSDHSLQQCSGKRAPDSTAATDSTAASECDNMTVAKRKLNFMVPSREMTATWRFVIGFGMAMVAGLLFGYTFTPAINLSQMDGNSQDQIDYVWSSFAGIVLAGNIIFVMYVLVRGEKSYTPRSVIMPGIASGTIWAVGQVAWFKANQELSLSIAFPIISSLPGIVALTLGVACFGELRTRRARMFAGAGVMVRLPGIILISLSNM